MQFFNRSRGTDTGRGTMGRQGHSAHSAHTGGKDGRLEKRGRRFVIGALVALALVGGSVLGGYLWLVADLPDIDRLDEGLQIPSVRITDRNGRLLYEVLSEGGGRHDPVALEDIPLHLQQATIAVEDANFYTNPGVDLRGVLRAMWINIRGGEVLSGGSTITQQVVRTLLFDPDVRTEISLRRKLREIILAYQLTQQLTKDEILALYLNQTYYGNLAYGAEAAAQTYFGRPVSDLDLAECALLAGLPQAPAVYDPLTNPEAAQERQSVVLDLMVAHGYITAEEADAARREPLSFAAAPFPIEAPHFVMAVYAQLPELIPQEALYAGGLEARTTLDLDWQHAAENIAARHLDYLNTARPGQAPQNVHDVALVALDPHTGQVLAMLGSPDYFDPQISGAINMALAPRQPGSTLKPITYAAAFDPTRPAPWTAATMILDVHTGFITHQGFSYAPVNYDRREHGPVLAREALASSYNIPAVIALQDVGVDTMVNLAQRLGVDTLDDDPDVDLSVTLGGGEVRLLDLTAAYGAFANGGRVVHPTLVLDVRDADGDVIYQSPSGLGEQVIDECVAWLITDILSDNLARAPTFTQHSALQIGRPAAAKTGTTTDFRDNWTVGYTPNLVVGVWVGNANRSPMTASTGAIGAAPIWHQFMRQVLQGQPELTFERPADMVQVEVCALSGLLPTPDCPYTRTEWFIPGTEPTEYDTLYRRVVIDRLTGLPADSSTPPERQEARVVLDLPPQAQEWARTQGLPLLADLQGASPGGTQQESGLRMISPDPNTVYRITAEIPLESQRLRFVAVGPAGARDVTLLLDGEPLATCAAPPFEAWWTLAVGEHQVWAEGSGADGEPLSSPPVTFWVNPPE
jgi:1A family penicillin-binding protein